MQQLAGTRPAPVEAAASASAVPGARTLGEILMLLR
jgi:hypothetical protein